MVYKKFIQFSFLTLFLTDLLHANSIPQVEMIRDWGIYNSQANSHIHAPEAWSITEGNSDVIVAIIDTGISAEDPLLAKNLWRNPLSPSKNEYGWDFVTGQPNPKDSHGHGTHIAGIIGALFDRESGITGVTHQVSLMPIRYYSDQNSEAVNLKNSIQAMNYAIDHGAKIINYSGGGPSFSEEEFQALKRAEQKGVLLVAAAGNEHSNTDLPEKAFYPADYPLSNIISVGANDIFNQIIPSSNWGKQSVYVLAPGDRILSTLPGGRKGNLTGTSQATAFVTGTAALLLARNKNLTPQQIKELIGLSADTSSSFKDRVRTQGHVNAFEALKRVK
jgi:thermitase